jgi:hypothetical protein
MEVASLSVIGNALQTQIWVSGLYFVASNCFAFSSSKRENGMTKDNCALGKLTRWEFGKFPISQHVAFLEDRAIIIL